MTKFNLESTGKSAEIDVKSCESIEDFAASIMVEFGLDFAEEIVKIGYPGMELMEINGDKVFFNEGSCNSFEALQVLCGSDFAPPEFEIKTSPRNVLDPDAVAKQLKKLKDLGPHKPMRTMSGIAEEEPVAARVGGHRELAISCALDLGKVFDASTKISPARTVRPSSPELMGLSSPLVKGGSSTTAK